MTRITHLSCFILLMFLVISCAGGGGAQPVVPSSNLTESPNALSNARDPDSLSGDTHALWGYWQCELDTVTNEVTALRDRTGMMHLNVVGPINKSLGMSVSIDGDKSNPAGGYFVLTMSLTHPYPGNPKLTGFDVRGIMITTAGLSGNGWTLPGAMDPAILNPDGYTRWWNPVEFPTPGLLGYTPGIYGKDPPIDKPLASMINPYKQFSDGLYVTHDIFFLTLILPTSSNGRGVFKSGSTCSREYEIQFPLNPGPKVWFNYAIDASWAMPSGDPPNIPNDFPLYANGDEAFILDAKVTSSTLWAAGGPQAGGDISLEIECWDWQGWLDGYDGEIDALKLVSPYCVFQEGVIPEYEVPGTGKAILTATLTGMPSMPGTIPVWIGLTAPGSNYQQTGTPAPNDLIAAFDLVEVNVAEAECEDNLSDNCVTADEIAPEDSRDGLLCLNVDDRDWYHFSVYTGGSAEGTIHLTSYNTGDLTLFLYKNCPPSLEDYSSNPGNVDEEMVVSGLVEGDYYIQVIEEDDGDNAPRPYTLTTSLTNLGVPCTVDSNNDSSEASPINIVDSVDELVCLSGDPTDWYTFDIADGTTGFGTIELLNGGLANNDLAVYDSSISTPLYIGNNPGTADELIEVSLGPGTYYIRLDAQDSAPLGDRPYTLNTDIEEIVSDCDDTDGNNTWSESAAIGLVDEKTGTVCHPTDPDWYTFDVGPDGANGDITLSSGDLFDNDLFVYSDPTTPPIYESSQTGNMDEILAVELSEGTYYIKAAASSSATSVNQNYTLTTNLSGVVSSPTDIYLHVHIIRTNAGENPAASEAKVNSDVAWGNEFWDIWVDGGLIIDEITYIDRTSWLSATVDESLDMFAQYATNDGALNVFYVNDFPDMSGAAAYTWMECQFIAQAYDTGFIMMSDYADSATLAHEAFHGAGLLEDMYLLDWYNCDELVDCPQGPSDIYCDPADAVWGNLMYWPVGENINDYFISNDDLYGGSSFIQSQGENVMYFQTEYPDNFFKP